MGAAKQLCGNSVAVRIMTNALMLGSPLLRSFHWPTQEHHAPDMIAVPACSEQALDGLESIWFRHRFPIRGDVITASVRRDGGINALVSDEEKTTPEGVYPSGVRS